MVVLCFGASLTAQIGLGGYVGHLSKLGARVQCAGFGGYQLEHAHLVVKDISFSDIDTIIVEWFSPVKIYSDTEIELYLGTLLSKLTKAARNPKILCVMIPNRKTGSHTNYFSSLAKYLSKVNVPYLNLDCIEIESGDLKEDGLHTLEKGALKYAKKIMENLSVLNPILTFPLSNELFNVKELNQTFVAEVGEEIHIASIEPCHVIGITMIVGPKSGIILMNGRPINVWDKWSGRDRTTIKYNFYTPCTIKPTDTAFDKSSSALQPKWGPVNFEIRKIYYVGNDLSVCVRKSKNYSQV